MCGKWGKTLNEDPDQLECYERTPEPSFIAVDCLPFFFFSQLGPPEVWRKVTYSMLELTAVVPGPRVFCCKCINAAFKGFLTTWYKGYVLENLKSSYQAFYKLEKIMQLGELVKKKSLMFLNRLIIAKKNVANRNVRGRVLCLKYLFKYLCFNMDSFHCD